MDLRGIVALGEVKDSLLLGVSTVNRHLSGVLYCSCMLNGQAGVNVETRVCGCLNARDNFTVPLLPGFGAFLLLKFDSRMTV